MTAPTSIVPYLLHDPADASVHISEHVHYCALQAHIDQSISNSLELLQDRQAPGSSLQHGSIGCFRRPPLEVLPCKSLM